MSELQPVSDKPAWLQRYEEMMASAAAARQRMVVSRATPRPRGAARCRTQPTDVYRFYDRDGALLYVGLSCTLAARIGAHRWWQGWWRDVQRIEIEHLASRDAAAKRERELIATLAPRYNRNGGGA